MVLLCWYYLSCATREHYSLSYTHSEMRVSAGFRIIWLLINKSSLLHSCLEKQALFPRNLVIIMIVLFHEQLFPEHDMGNKHTTQQGKKPQSARCSKKMHSHTHTCHILAFIFIISIILESSFLDALNPRHIVLRVH